MSFEKNKNQSQTPFSRLEMIQMMRYQFDIGVDETLTEIPQNRYQAARQALDKLPQATAPQTHMSEAPANMPAPPLKIALKAACKPARKQSLAPSRPPIFRKMTSPARRLWLMPPKILTP